MIIGELFFLLFSSEETKERQNFSVPPLFFAEVLSQELALMPLLTHTGVNDARFLPPLEPHFLTWFAGFLAGWLTGSLVHWLGLTLSVPIRKTFDCGKLGLVRSARFDTARLSLTHSLTQSVKH